MKKWIRFVALLSAVVLLAGCNLIGVDPQLDAQQTVAQVGDTVITKAEWQSMRDDMISYYEYLYSMYGMSFNASDASTITAMGEDALEAMIQEEVLLQKATQLGLDTFTDEELASIEADVNENMDTQRMYYQMMYFYDADPQSATLSEAVDARLAEDGYTVEAMTESLKTEQIYARVREAAIADVQVSEDEIKADYDQKVADQQAAYDATPTQYASAVNSGTDVYYVPAGYRGIKHVLVQLDSAKQSEITSLRSTLSANTTSRTSLQSQLAELTAEPAEGEEEPTEEQKAADEQSIALIEEQLAALDASDAETNAQLETLTKEAYDEIRPEAEMVLALAKGDLDAAKALYAQMNPTQPEEETEIATPDEAVTPDEATTPEEDADTEDEDKPLDVSALTEPVDFDTLIAEYNDDPGMRSEPQMTTGYALCEGLTLYETPFQEAAMALEAVGDVSDIVEGTNGYHILYYAGDIPAGAVDYQSVKDAIEEALLTTKQNETYQSTVETWVSEANVKTFPKAMEDIR